MTTVIGVALGAVVGLILGLTGAGGGILAVPLLLFGLGMTIREAAPVALVAVGLSAGFTALLGLREGIVRYRAAALIGVAGMLCTPFGLWLARQLPEGPLLLIFAAVLAYSSWRMFEKSRAAILPTSDAQCHPQLPCVVNPSVGRLQWTAPCARALAGTGLFSGLMTGMLGVGGGFVIVPALSHYTDLPQRSIVATSLAVIALVSLGGVTSAAVSGGIVWLTALPFVMGTVAGISVGRVAARWIAGPRLQQLFALVGGIVALLMIYKAWHHGL